MLSFKNIPTYPFPSFRLRREAAEVDRQLEAAQTETARLQTLLRTREAEVSLFLDHFFLCTHLKHLVTISPSIPGTSPT